MYGQPLTHAYKQILLLIKWITFNGYYILIYIIMQHFEKNIKKTLASYGNSVYNNERCDYAMMQDVAVTNYL